MEGLPWIPRRPFLDPRFFGVFSGSPSTLGSSPDPRLFVGPWRPSLDPRPEKTSSLDPRRFPGDICSEKLIFRLCSWWTLW